MNYKKLAVYLFLALVVLGFWYKNNRDAQRRLDDYNRFADAYAGTAVMAELYRNEPDRFLRARDSIYQVYGFSPASIEQFQTSMQDHEEDWTLVWDAIRFRTDSLAKYYTIHPVEHIIPDSSGMVSPISKE